MTGLVVTGAAAVRDPAWPPSPDGSWFDPVPLLGRRGWKYLSPATRYLLGAAALAIRDAALDPAALPAERMGVVVGTNFAAAPVVERLDRIVVTEGADLLSPAEAPNFSVNLPASNISMRYGMRAFNLTLTNPMVAGLESVLTLAAAIRRGRAALGVAGAVEERHDPAAVSDAACCLIVEDAEAAAERDAAVRGRVLGGWCRFAPPGTGLDPLREPLRRLMTEPGPDGELPVTVVTDAVAAGPGERLAERVARLCEETAAQCGITLRHEESGDPDGRHRCVSPLLAAAEQLAAGRPGLTIAAGTHGHVAALRLSA